MTYLSNTSFYHACNFLQSFITCPEPVIFRQCGCSKQMDIHKTESQSHQLMTLDQYSLLVSDLGLQAVRSNRNKRSDVAFSGVDWEEDADPFSIIGFIPQGCSLIAFHARRPCVALLLLMKTVA